MKNLTTSFIYVRRKKGHYHQWILFMKLLSIAQISPLSSQSLLKRCYVVVINENVKWNLHITTTTRVHNRMIWFYFCILFIHKRHFKLQKAFNWLPFYFALQVFDMYVTYFNFQMKWNLSVVKKGEEKGTQTLGYDSNQKNLSNWDDESWIIEVKTWAIEIWAPSCSGFLKIRKCSFMKYEAL